MQNAPNPATAEGMPNTSRRRFLTRSAAALAGTALTAGSALAATAVQPFNPMLETLKQYRLVNDRLNVSWWIEEDEDVDAYVEQFIDPIFDRLRDDTPETTTMAGAIAALRFLDSGASDPDADSAVIQSVLAILEGGAR